jgi:heptosyltransferase-2
MYPYLPQNPERMVIIENNNLNCRPCSKIGFSACPKGHFDCMNKLDSNEIATSLQRISAKEQKP